MDLSETFGDSGLLYMSHILCEVDIGINPYVH